MIETCSENQNKKLTKLAAIHFRLKQVCQLFLARLTGFEPATIGIGIRYSIRAELKADIRYKSHAEHYNTHFHYCKDIKDIFLKYCSNKGFYGIIKPVDFIDFC